MKLKIYAYKNCDTCRKAKKFLEGEGIDYELIPIREQPPTKTELQTMLGNYDGNIRKLFNTSGGDYKAMNLKDKLSEMTDSQAVELLSQNGNLVKRPFALKGKTGLVGFYEAAWSEAFA
jgi:arsenate reductase